MSMWFAENLGVSNEKRCKSLIIIPPIIYVLPLLHLQPYKKDLLLSSIKLLVFCVINF